MGLTVQPAPVLYWHASEATSVRIEITLIDEESVKPLLEFPVEGPVLAGTHSVRLVDHDIRLQPDQLYEWSVTMVETPGRRGAADRVAKGFVQRVAASEELRKQLESVEDPERAAVYARHGIWYDALADLSEQLATDPSDQQAGRLRAALLVQVGLSGLDSEALRAPAKQEP